MSRKNPSGVGYVREFTKIFESLCYRYDRWSVFADFLFLAAAAFMQRVQFDPEREQEYLHTIGRYDRDREAPLFPKLLAVTTLALDERPHDFLGHLSGELGILSKWGGQFFTPYDLSRLLAELTLDPEAITALPFGQFVMLNEPACGGGSMVIAVYDYLREKGVDTQHKVFTVVQDVDHRAIHMTYLQLALLDIPARVILGNTLKNEVRAVYHTPSVRLYNWPHRLRHAREITAVAEATPSTASRAPPAEMIGQLARFSEPESPTPAQPKPRRRKKKKHRHGKTQNTPPALPPQQLSLTLFESSDEDD
jgi:hypothetical protein